MTTDRWEQVKVAFDEALKREPAARAAYLATVCAEDDALLNEVQSLLAAYDDAPSFIEHPVMGVPPPPGEHADPMANRRIGPYRILRKAGRGGMAEVYLAVRADRLYQRFVAIKLVRTGLDSDEVLRRFRHERQTLAVLDHPNIVKLLDAGTTDEGLPYLVMDFVQGQPVDKYCESRRLSVAERLELFRTICAAVHYAHQNLVVHRDLKPSNVLVTADGVPKLLDFGIAKLLRPEFSPDTIGLTRSELRPMTPDYASPEQIRGEPITTASDIYSLGVLLYLLLTSHRPYRMKGHSALEYERAICETEPERPSLMVSRSDDAATGDDKLRRKLEGDLDNIVLMAMRKEPQRRYASAEQLSDDIRRHLAALPVVAHKDTFGYRTAKFIRRHKAGAITAAAGIVFAVAGLVAILWQARVAEIERARAERRFNDVRQLAHFVLFDLDDALRSSTTVARRQLIAQVLPYLDRLKEDAPDPSIEVDLIEGYLKTGDVQGNLYGPNLGDAKSAEVSYRKALQRAESWSRVDPKGADRELARSNQKLGELLSISGDVNESLQRLTNAFHMFETRRAAAPGDQQALDDLLAACDALAGVQTLHKDFLDEALRTYDRYVAVSRERYAADSHKRRLALAKADVEIGKILAAKQQPDQAIERLRRALQVFEDLARQDPADVSSRDVAVAYINLGDVIASAGRSADALDAFRTGLRTFEALSKDDPQSQQYQRDRAVTLAYMAEALSTLRRKDEARARTIESLRLFKHLAEQPGASAQSHREYAWWIVSTSFPDLQDRAAAFDHAMQAKTMTYASDPATLDTLAAAYDLKGDVASAIAEEERALALLLDPESTAHLPEALRKNLAKFKEKSAKRAASR